LADFIEQNGVYFKMAARYEETNHPASENMEVTDEIGVFTDRYSDFGDEEIVNNDSDGDNGSNSGGSASENDLDSDDDLQDGFLNLHMNDALRAIIEDDDDDQIFHGFQPILNAIPDENWRNRQNVPQITAYNKRPH
jgi:hypothetical protein